MSSTTLPRNEKRQDFYYTPDWATQALVRDLGDVRIRGCRLSDCRVLDVGAGMGSIGSVLMDSFGFTDVSGVEIDSELTREANAISEFNWVRAGDFLKTQYNYQYDAIFMNPPYSQALEFVDHAIRSANTVYALLRVGFLGSRARLQWHRRNPAHVHILPKRPSFTADGKCDSCDYAWFEWSRRPGFIGGRYTHLSL